LSYLDILSYSISWALATSLTPRRERKLGNFVAKLARP
jgi:hypothetical protein